VRWGPEPAKAGRPPAPPELAIDRVQVANHLCLCAGSRLDPGAHSRLLDEAAPEGLWIEEKLSRPPQPVGSHAAVEDVLKTSLALPQADLVGHDAAQGGAQHRPRFGALLQQVVRHGEHELHEVEIAQRRALRDAEPLGVEALEMVAAAIEKRQQALGLPRSPGGLECRRPLPS